MTNCWTGKADQALSFWFLMQWLLGDITNLIGAVLTRQLATQVRAREGGRERGRERGREERERGGERGWKSLLKVIMCDFATKSRRT